MIGQEKISRVNRPSGLINLIDYIVLVFHLFLAKVFGYRTVVINLPFETQYPYLFYQFWKGQEFINFAEKLKKVFGLSLYWQNSYSAILEKYQLKNSSISWDSVPNQIDLMIDIPSLKKTSKKQPRIKTAFDKIVNLKGEQIKAVINNQEKIIRFPKLASPLSPVQKLLVLG